jgi:hypothetical protein
MYNIRTTIASILIGNKDAFNPDHHKVAALPAVPEKSVYSINRHSDCSHISPVAILYKTGELDARTHSSRVNPLDINVSFHGKG